VEGREGSLATELDAFLFDFSEFLYQEHEGQLPLVLQQNGVRNSLHQSSAHVHTLESAGTLEPIGLLRPLNPFALSSGGSILPFAVVAPSGAPCTLLLPFELPLDTLRYVRRMLIAAELLRAGRLPPQM
jgi:hypothetical protein